MTCKVTQNRVGVHAMEMSACKLLGLCLVTPQYVYGPVGVQVQRIKFNERWRHRNFGLCFAVEFVAQHKAHVDLVKAVMVCDKYVSKWWEMSAGVVNWKIKTELAGVWSREL